MWYPNKTRGRVKKSITDKLSEEVVEYSSMGEEVMGLIAGDEVTVMGGNEITTILPSLILKDES